MTRTPYSEHWISYSRTFAKKTPIDRWMSHSEDLATVWSFVGGLRRNSSQDAAACERISLEFVETVEVAGSANSSNRFVSLRRSVFFIRSRNLCFRARE